MSESLLYNCQLSQINTCITLLILHFHSVKDMDVASATTSVSSKPEMARVCGF